MCFRSEHVDFSAALGVAKEQAKCGLNVGHYQA